VAVTESSFTIEFPEHVKADKRQYCLSHLSETGASVETQSERVFRVICRKPSELAHVGWTLFQTHFVNVCDVTAVSGSAVNRASAYPKPSPR